MKFVYFTIHPGKNPPPQNGCRLKFIFFLKSTGFTSSTFPIQPEFSQSQPPAITLRGLPHYGNWGSVMWTMVPATFQSKCLHLITLPMVMYHTTGSLAPRQSAKNQNLEACDETVRRFFT
jgi:hypothetical protein